MAIELVGSTTAAASGSLSLTSLTGGIASAPAEGDIVFAVVAGSNSSDQDIAITGYTEVADLYANSTGFDTNLGVFWKVMGSTPDTSVTIPSLSNVRAVVYVLRGVDTTTPMDATRTTVTRTNTGIPDPASITSVTANAMILIASATSAFGVYVAPSGFSNTVKRESAEMNVLVSSKIKVTAGADNPGIWTGIDEDESVFSCASVTMALRPAPAGTTGRIKVWNGSAWVAKPVKVWNGSAWVVKPVKRWNGSAWVTTSY
jgi:hypothetical protein